MPAFVLDSSAVIAYLHREPGWEVAEEYVFGDSVVSAVNLAEIITKLLARGTSEADIRVAFAFVTLTSTALTDEIAFEAGRIHAATRHLGLSMADAACVATARALGATAVTADRTWADLPDEVRIIR
ncbi:MAG: type II toxin-antitoxin system VapC family toxin [Chloroflexi bacterium]|nr:type II toxin-antitoxin system VapC family toxin [Chloroflexota bacterium]MDA1240846.1 type II toxin-antitoxin system VapC family toxin [Chloroflexota bacterium]